MIRLQRVGRKNHAEFRLVVTEKTRAAKSSNYVELLGNYNPHTNTAQFDTDRVKYWIAAGAQPSDTVHNLLVEKKVIEGKKKNVLPKKTPIAKEAAPAPAETEAAPVAEEQKEEAVTQEA